MIRALSEVEETNRDEGGGEAKKIPIEKKKKSGVTGSV